ncbi:MAG: helix-turn-helix transcriptional regulator, partial [Pseudomonadota bacterium]
MTTLEDPGFLTTREVAALLRVKQRRVYDLAASGEIPHTKATGKLLFQRADIDAWLSAQQAPRPPGQPQAPVGVTRPEVIAGSHDPLLDWALRASGARIANLFDSSLDGLEEVATGRAAACGLHLLDAATGEWNIGPVATRLPRDFVLISWARRARGLLLAPGREVKSLAALAGRRLVCRQPGAGAQIHLESELARAGLALTDFACLPEPARSEAE